LAKFRLHETCAVEKRDPQRTKELNELKQALATFAARLDAFEARLKGRQVEMSVEPSLASPGVGFAKKVIAAMGNYLAQD
jgi:hypothetical protein